MTENKDRSEFKIGTRESELALWQARYVRNILTETFPQYTFTVCGMTTMGDKDQMKPLTDFGSKGVFTKELDIALISGTIDLAVHCMKDLPTTLPEGLVSGCTLIRGDTEDALLVHPKHKEKTLETLPPGSVIGTSAMRRKAVLKRYYPHFETKDIRGNVHTRISKLDRGDYDAIILAKVGLKRVDLDNRITQVLDVDKFGYAVGQGALSVLYREGDDTVAKLLAVMNHIPTQLACEAERGMLRTLNGGCKVPIVTRCVVEELPSENDSGDDTKNSTGSVNLELYGAVISVDGKTVIEKTTKLDEPLSLSADSDKALEAIVAARGLGELVGDELRKEGADVILGDHI